MGAPRKNCRSRVPRDRLVSLVPLCTVDLQGLVCCSTVRALSLDPDGDVHTVHQNCLVYVEGDILMLSVETNSPSLNDLEVDWSRRT
jgi:hypothetical protein